MEQTITATIYYADSSALVKRYPTTRWGLFHVNEPGRARRSIRYVRPDYGDL